MDYTKDEKTGHFRGQNGYGYVSIENWVREATNQGYNSSQKDLAFINSISCIWTTVILEAGRLSLDSDNHPITIDYVDEKNPIPIAMRIT